MFKFFSDSPPNPCENVYCGYGQCRDGICDCQAGYSGHQCDIGRKCFFMR